MTDPNIRTGFAIIGSFADVFDVMFGPQQADAHVVAWRRHGFLKQWEARHEAGAQAVREAAEEIKAAHRERVARLRSASAASVATQIAAE